jgi:hypothetical protein
MAKQQQTQVIGSVMIAEDGFLYIKGLEDNQLQKYLDEYAARIGGYRQVPGDVCTNVTMKIIFPDDVSDGNANLWAFFIAKAAHPTCSKPRTKIERQNDTVVAYVTWPIWNQVKHVESKNQQNTSSF